MHGWLILDKPLGLGSTQAVSAVKRALRAGGYPKLKVGHGGTLDPLASGVLPVALGEATKLAGRLLDSDKVYDFTIAFGVETDTLDAEGREAATSDHRPTLAEVAAVLPGFTGAIEQVPPAYSALKVDGARAYDRARAGETVELARRQVTVHNLKILPVYGEGDHAQHGGGGGQPIEPLALQPPPSVAPAARHLPVNGEDLCANPEILPARGEGDPSRKRRVEGGRHHHRHRPDARPLRRACGAPPPRERGGFFGEPQILPVNGKDRRALVRRGPPPVSATARSAP